MTRHMRRKFKRIAHIIVVTALAFVIVAIFLMPFLYAVVTSLKTEIQISQASETLLPSSPKTFLHEGKACPVFHVPTAEGIKLLALVKPGREQSAFIDPEHPESGVIQWEGKWRTLQQVWEPDIQWNNYQETWNRINFPLLLRNTLMYAVLSTFGAVSSAACVAYGFARFAIPKKQVLFLLVLSTILLPPAVTLIPRYVFFYKLGWVGTWLPMIVPAFFSNGYNVFLLRQFFLGIPRELDEAAKIDGAGPAKIFLAVIIPQAIPALIAVTLFHFFYCWNDFLEPLIFLAGKSSWYPITIGLTQFNKQFSQETHLIQAGAMISLVLPLTLFFIAQRFFMQGVVITGVEK